MSESVDASSDPELAQQQLEEDQIQRPIPSGLALSERSTAYLASPHLLLDELRNRDPVHRDDVCHRVVLTRHEDVQRVLNDPALWRDPRHGNCNSFARAEARGADPASTWLALDGPAHARWREMLKPALTRNAVAAYQPRIDAAIKTIIDDLDANEFEFDVFAKYAVRVANTVMADLLGVPVSRWLNFRTWSGQLNDACFNSEPSDAEVERADVARDELNKLFQNAIAARRNAPQADLISALMELHSDGTPLTDAEVVEQCQVLLLAGTAPLAGLIGNSIRGMLQNTKQMTRIRARPEILGNAIEEMLRFDPPVIAALRIAHQDMIVGGCPVAKGETLWAALSAANRDPDVYPDADRLDVFRLDTHHQSFGGGVHMCLGDELVRAIAKEAIHALVMCFEDLEASARGWNFAPKRNLRIMQQLWVRA